MVDGGDLKKPDWVEWSRVEEPSRSGDVKGFEARQTDGEVMV